MNIFRKTLIVVLVLHTFSTTFHVFAQTKDSLKAPAFQSYIDRAKSKTEIMAKELGLTSEQKELVASAIARRNF